MGPKKLLSRGDNLWSFPTDLIIEIFSRLPAKSIARCRCVSKLWCSEIRRQDFTESFLTKSSAGRPKLLFACQGDKKLSFFSADQPQNPEENSCVVVANYILRFRCDYRYDNKVFAPVSGFLCLCLIERQKLNLNVCSNSLWVIWNPSTREYFHIPKGITKRKLGVACYIGYDPTEKKFKALLMTWLAGSGRLAGRGKISEEHQVMTLGTDQPCWKMVECCIPHYPGVDSGICINGVLYYKARADKSCEDSMIVCFDFRSEKFSVLKGNEPFFREKYYQPTMTNYNGKLGLLIKDPPRGRTTSFELWVLEDEGKQEWSKRVYVLPTLWESVVGDTMLDFVGMIGTHEIVLSPCYQTIPYDKTIPCYIFYYNTERKTVTRVTIQGMEAFKGCSLKTFLNYGDNLMLIQD